MFIRWQRRSDRPRSKTRYYRDAKADAYAILVESTRVKGKPRQRHIAYLGSVHAVHRKQSPQYRAEFWQRIRAKLDSLHKRISPDDRRKIEAALAEKVPPLTRDEKSALRAGEKRRKSAKFSRMQTAVAEIESSRRRALRRHPAK